MFFTQTVLSNGWNLIIVVQSVVKLYKDDEMDNDYYDNCHKIKFL